MMECRDALRASRDDISATTHISPNSRATILSDHWWAYANGRAHQANHCLLAMLHRVFGLSSLPMAHNQEHRPPLELHHSSPQVNSQPPVASSRQFVKRTCLSPFPLVHGRVFANKWPIGPLTFLNDTLLLFAHLAAFFCKPMGSTLLLNKRDALSAYFGFLSTDLCPISINCAICLIRLRKGVNRSFIIYYCH